MIEINFHTYRWIILQLSVTASLYDVLQWKVFLDAFAGGLEVFHLKTAMNTFPELLRELFIASDECSPSDGNPSLQCDS